MAQLTIANTIRLQLAESIERETHHGITASRRCGITMAPGMVEGSRSFLRLACLELSLRPWAKRLMSLSLVRDETTPSSRTHLTRSDFGPPPSARSLKPSGASGDLANGMDQIDRQSCLLGIDTLAKFF
ncbi:hypothetical protein CRG98_013534 [Punica granatum]|uniref:Uncharacterized protein n=1 Tax=Punica granatum TaxID=22663 RepID=A0A2I0KBX7_PUNGR|nr:hypothetical protein CRG98_013534 [Punica granatum]